MDKKNVCVVFDLDDTLYLERDFAYSGFRAVGEWCADRLGLHGIREQAQVLFDQGRRSEIFDTIVERRGVESKVETIAAMVRIFRGHAPQIALLPDASECLARLRNRVYLGLLSDGNSQSQRAKIEALGLNGHFDATAFTGDWGIQFFKPHLRGYRCLESQLEMCRGRFVYVADNPAKDFFAPRELGWESIRVRREGSLQEHRECPSGLARCEVSNLEPVPGLVLELFKASF
jgi:putative hydrolase of the HAD superfamily